MTDTNGSERLDKIQAILEGTIKVTEANSRDLAETRLLIESNSRAIGRTNASIEETRKLAELNTRAIQAMLEERATNQLKHETQLEEQRELNRRLLTYIDGLGNMMSKIDENQPSILRKLTTIENKLDSLQTIETKLDRLIEDK